jgi:prepilin-type N-terminal cleavage/methylation domain-containing protein
VSPLRASRFGGQVHLRPSGYGAQVGFTLLELLIALAISSLVAAGIAGIVPPARAAFEHTPAALDLQQRARTIVEAIAQPVRSGGVPGVVPAIVLTDADPLGETFATLQVIVRRSGGAEGVLEEDQAGESGALVLSETRCPDVEDVCGFTSGAGVVIADGDGRFDLFLVRDTSVGAHSLESTIAFSEAYPAGSMVVEVDAYTFRLDAQPDGSTSLVRETLAGAIQPVVDRVRALTFRRSERLLDMDVMLDPGRLRLRAGIFMRNAS